MCAQRPATGAAATSGYELSVQTFDLSGVDPLDAINWGGDEMSFPAPPTE